jgi:branched-chain amino acid transport system substrate-binding protein
MPRWLNTWRWAALATLLLALGGGAWFAWSRDAGQDDDTIVFGATISITGKTAREGRFALDGYQFAIDTINARGGIHVGDRSYKLALRYYNDGSDPQRAAVLYEKLIAEDRVDFLLGPYGSSTTAAIAPVADLNRLPLVTGHGSADSIYTKGYSYVFNIQTPASRYLQGVIDIVLAADPSVRRVAILAEEDVFAEAVVAGAISYAAERGLTVVYHGNYPTDTHDVGDLLRAAAAHNPELLLGAGHLQDTILIVKQAKELGLAPKAMGLSVGTSSPDFREYLGADADYIFGATQWTSTLHYTGGGLWATPATYAEAFLAAHPDYAEVPYQTAESTASLLVFQLAIERAGSLDPLRVRNALADLRATTFFGPIAFDERGVNSSKPIAVEQFSPDGHKYVVFPFEAAERPALYPMPPWDAR